MCLPPSLPCLCRKTVFLGSAIAMAQFCKTGGAFAQTAGYDASMLTLFLDKMHPRKNIRHLRRGRNHLLHRFPPLGHPQYLVGFRPGLQSKPPLASGQEVLPLPPQELPGGQNSWGGLQWASNPPGSQGVYLCVLQMLPLSLALTRG